MNNSTNSLSILQDNQISYKFEHRTVLNDLNFVINHSESVAIVGISGSGKSTLLHLLGGLDNIQKGEIKWHQQNIANLSENQRSDLRNRYLGFVYQFHHLLPEFSALENIMMPLWIRKDNKAKIKAQQILAELSLSDLAHHKPFALSGGQRQKIALARSLVTEPNCLLADEPTGNLDENSANDVLNMMLKHCQQRGMALVLVTHDLNLAHKVNFCYRLEKGQLHPINFNR